MMYKTMRALVMLGAMIVLAWACAVLGRDAPHSTPRPTSIPATRRPTAIPWKPPEGFNNWGDDDLAYRMVEKGCSYSIASCAHYEIYSRYGCPSSLYVEVAFYDKAGVLVDWSNDTAPVLSAAGRALLEFVTFEDTASKVKITEILCY